jgi:hypothetical protein
LAYPKTSGLKGAARPAWEVYPELYPEMHVKEPEEPAIDEIARVSPHCFANPHCRPLVGLHFQLGFAHLLQNDGAAARRAFRQCLELEVSDPFHCNTALVFASNQANLLPEVDVSDICFFVVKEFDDVVKM